MLCVEYRYEVLVREVLLGTQFPGAFFGCSVMRFINHQFMTHDFTTAVLRKGLQVGTCTSALSAYYIRIINEHMFGLSVVLSMCFEPQIPTHQLQWLLLLVL